MFALLRRIVLPSEPGAFRLWLAMVVVIHHVTRLEFGQAPVRVFFALSGYWVYRVWTKRYQLCEAPWLTFVVSRWWRIAPVMVVAVTACVGLLGLLHLPMLKAVGASAGHQLFSSVFVLGYAGMDERPLGPAWSLDVEMQFYLVAPLLVLLVNRLSAVVAFFLAFMVYTAGIAIYPDMVLSSFLAWFVLGMVAARHQWTVPAPIGTAGQALAVVLVIGAFLSPWRHLLLDQGDWWANFNFVLAALCLPQALVSVQGKGGALDSYWSEQSYVLYLMHWPGIMLLFAFTRPGQDGYVPILIGLSLATALLCWAVHRWVDRPFNRARARWVSSRSLARSPRETATKGDDSAPVFA